MTAPRNPDRLIRAFLAEGQDELPDQVYDAVRDRIEQTNQRVVIGPWRTPFMNKFVAIGLGAAAVVVALFIGAQLVGQPTVVGPPTETLSPTETPAATPEPTTRAFPRAGPLTGGRYSMTREGISFSIEVPATGWISNGEFLISKGVPGGEFIFWGDTPDGAYADPCAAAQGPVIGPSAAELAAAVAAIPGTELVSGPTEVTVGGRPAQYVEIRVPEDPGCAAEEFMLWYDEQTGGRWPTGLGDTIRTWIIEADGALVWIDCETVGDASAATEQEIQQMIDSIQFE